MPVIEVTNLHKRYGDRIAVHDLSFTVEPGEIFGILGPNGAGKTTTVECVEGLRTPDGGTVRVLGLDPHRDRAELRQRVGVQLQESQLPDKIKVGEALDLYASFYRDPADPGELLAVTAVSRAGGRVLVTGTGNVLHAVTSVLARQQIVANELRVEQTSLDDAYVALTGHGLDN